MTAPAIVTAGLTKRFGEVVAVDDLDLEVPAGEVFGFLGPNGAGKTTTIRLLLDFVRPTGGRATVLGGSCADARLRQRVGYVPGELHLDPRLTGHELLDYFARLRGGVDAVTRAALVERFDLDETRPIGQLSTGNRQKVALVQAFMHQPELLLLDEPTAGLDPFLQREFSDLVHEVTADERTVFLSSHLLPEVEEIADRVGIIDRGRLLRVAAIGELLGQARQQIELHFADPVPADDFAGMPGVRPSQHGSRVVKLDVEGSVDAVVKAAAAHTVTRIVSSQPDLEEIFLELYRRDGEGET